MVIAVFLLLSATIEAMTISSTTSHTIETYLPRWAFRVAVVTWVCVCMWNASVENAYPYTLAYAVPVIVVYNAYLGNYYMVILQIFVVIPVLELFSGEDHENPTREQAKEMQTRHSFRWIALAWLPTQLAVIAWGIHVSHAWALSGLDFFLLAMSVGVASGGIGINVAHECIHKPTWYEKLAGRTLLASVCYHHFYIEHLYGHHKLVSTPDDPASMRYNESIFAFYPRSVYGSFVSAWHLAAERTAKAGFHPLHPLRNDVINGILASIAMASAAYALYGLSGLAFFLLQSWVAFSLLELVNAIEHAGLEREPEEGGVGGYERVLPYHSWNASARVTDRFLFRLQRHSHHHAQGGVRYQLLKSYADAPQMPTGYAGMIVLVLFPPLWFAVMNPRIKAARAHMCMPMPE